MKRMKFIICLILYLFVSYKALPSNTNGNLPKSMIGVANAASGMEKVMALDSLSRLYWFSNPDSALYFSKQALEEAIKAKDKSCLAEAYQSMGNAYFFKGKNEEALGYYRKSLEFRKNMENQIKVAKVYSNMGMVCINLNRYAEANQYALKAADIAHNIGDTQFEGQSYYNITRNYIAIRAFDDAMKFALKALDLYSKNNNMDGIADVNRLLGSIQFELKNYKLAETYYLKAYNYLAAKNDTKRLAFLYVELGMLYDNLGDVHKSIDFFQRSATLAYKQNDRLKLAVAYNNLGYINLKINNYDKAIEHFEKSLKILYSLNASKPEMYLNTCNNLANAYLRKGNIKMADHYAGIVEQNFNKLSNPMFIKETYQILSDLSRQKGNYRLALKYKSQELSYKDTLYNQEKNRITMEMLARFETEKKEHEIELLKKESEIKQLELKRNQTLQTVLFTALFLLLVIIVIIIAGYRLIREKNTLLALRNDELNNANALLLKSEQNLKKINSTKDKLFSIIAHDLKNPFNPLLGFCGLLDNEYDKLSENEKREYIQIIHESSQRLFRLLDNLLQWSRSQLKSITYAPENVNLNKLMSQEIEFLQKNADNKNISIKKSIDESQFVYADINTTASIFRNLISNAIKFTHEGGTIEITASHKMDTKMAEITVIDSGVGMSDSEVEKLFDINASFTTKGTTNESGTGLGLLLCQEFVENNHGKIWALSQKGKGSAFHVMLPAGK